MLSFMQYNLQEYLVEPNITKINKACVCCTSQNGVLLNIDTCKHTTFLKNNIKYKMDLKNKYVCIVCHNMLKKIEIFQQQAEESFALLMDQAPVLKINKLHNFQRSSIEINGTPKHDPDFEIKPEPIEVAPDFETDVKVEHDSDFEAEIPLSNLKKKNSQQEEKYGGKIRVVMLNKKELEEERQKMAKKEGYLKLPFKCENCIIGFDHELNLKTHFETRHKKKRNGLLCDVCKSELGTKMSYNEHMKRHVRRLECTICGKRYNHVRSAIQHYDEQHAPAGTGLQQGYTCKECGFTTASNRSYRYHMDKHKQKKQCKICGNTFVNSNGLKVHMYTVHKQSSRQYKCDKCDKTYRARSGLVSHSRSAHGTESRAFCVLCRTYFRSEQGLVHHLATHSKHISESDKRFICNECGAKFVKKSNLQVHINWEHLKIDTHRCNKCTKVFKSGPALNRHINYVHLMKRPPRNKICDYCGRAFTTQSILQSHIRTHTGERPLQCTHCPATFAHSAALYTHNKLLHTKK